MDVNTTMALEKPVQSGIILGQVEFSLDPNFTSALRANR